MSLTTEMALHALADAAHPSSDSRQAQRLREAQLLLHDGLRWVEQSLKKAVSVGVEPARSAARHLVENGGKRVRPTATLLCAACFGNQSEQVRELAVVVEIVHSSTLLHDDVIDEGDERRGTRTSRLLYGNAVSVLAGDVLLVHSLKRVSQIAPELMGDLLDTMTALVSGEVVQLRGRNRVDTSEQTYESILRDKTASLFRFAAAGAARLSGVSQEKELALAEFGERLGMAFQLIDDVLDYSGTKTGKTLCADLREGKVTLPLVLAAQEDPSLEQAVARAHAGDDQVMQEIQQRVIQSGACEQVQRRAQAQTERAISALGAVEDSPAKSLLVQVAQQLAARGA
jgi:octaprenyl-diphosphate synthase